MKAQVKQHACDTVLSITTKRLHIVIYMKNFRDAEIQYDDQ